jgi:antitoxin PrlF
MNQSTVTSKGQITIPKAIRDRLRLRQGDVLEFCEDEHGRIYFDAIRSNVRDLAGILYSPSRVPVTVTQMDEAIASYHAKSHSRITRSTEKP